MALASFATAFVLVDRVSMGLGTAAAFACNARKSYQTCNAHLCVHSGHTTALALITCSHNAMRSRHTLKVRRSSTHLVADGLALLGELLRRIGAHSAEAQLVWEHVCHRSAYSKKQHERLNWEQRYHIFASQHLCDLCCKWIGLRMGKMLGTAAAAKVCTVPQLLT